MIPLPCVLPSTAPLTFLAILGTSGGGRDVAHGAAALEVMKRKVSVIFSRINQDKIQDIKYHFNHMIHDIAKRIEGFNLENLMTMDIGKPKMANDQLYDIMVGSKRYLMSVQG